MALAVLSIAVACKSEGKKVKKGYQTHGDNTV